LEEASGTAIVTLRLKVEDRKITEAEWVLSRRVIRASVRRAERQANAAYNDTDCLIAHPPGERVVPKAERVSWQTRSPSPILISMDFRRTTGNLFCRIPLASGWRTGR
jgi:hypothetical protein